jgi:hypothetical protein
MGTIRVLGRIHFTNEIISYVLEMPRKSGYSLANFTGGAFRRQHDGSLLPPLEHLLIENSDADRGK